MKLLTDLFSKQSCYICILVLLAFNTHATQPSTLAALIEKSEALTKAPLIPRQQLLAKSKLSQVTLAPDGLSLIYAIKEGQNDNSFHSFWHYQINTQQHKKLFIANNIANIHWTRDSQHVFLDLGNGIAVSHLGGDSTPVRIVDFALKDAWLGIDLSQASSFLLKKWHGGDNTFDLQRINHQGEVTTLYRSPSPFHQIKVDLTSGKPLLLTSLNQSDNSKGEKNIFDISGATPQLIWQCTWDDDCNIFHFDKENNRLLMTSNYQSDLSRLIWFDLTSEKVTEIHHDPLNFADLEEVNLLVEPTHSKLTVRFAAYHGDEIKNYGLTKQDQLYISLIEQQLQTTSLLLQLPQISPFTKDLSPHWLITNVNNQHAQASYYLFEPRSKKLIPILTEQTSHANQQQPLMPSNAVAPKYAIHYPARDGVMLQGYLTLPRGTTIKNAPLVVDIHGGPWARVNNDYDKKAQLLANRGYIVFQPNFRASKGFGKRYMQGTDHDFGDGTTQNDIIDGVHFLLANAIGDKSRLAAVGHSFGGFSTLASLSFTPELFNVGFAGAPPSDLGRSAKYYFRYNEKMRREYNDYFIKQLVVDWHDKSAFDALYQQSPDAHINKITKPLVIWAGKYDRRVFIVDVLDYALRAQEQDKTVSLFVDPNALHAPTNKMGLEAYMYLMELTLATHLKGKLEPLETTRNKALHRFIIKNMKIDGNSLIN